MWMTSHFVYVCIYIYVHIHHVFLIHSSIDKHLGCLLQWRMLQWAWEYRYLFQVIVLFPLHLYVEVGLLDHMVWKVCESVSFSVVSDWSPMDCSPPGSCVCGIVQPRILRWVAIPLSRRTSQPMDRTWVSCIAGGFFTIWAIREEKTSILNLILFSRDNGAYSV